MIDDAITALPAPMPAPRHGWLAGLVTRPLASPGLETRIPLAPGDRPLVEAGATIRPGDPLVEHLRDPRVEEVAIRSLDGEPAPMAGARWRAPAPTGRRARKATDGELLAPVPGQRDRWRIVTGDHRDPVASVVGGDVLGVQPGSGIHLRVAGLAIPASFAAGAATSGRLELAVDPFGELRPGGIDVGRAGSILVVGSRIDAEALTRARAMGVRGIIVGSLAGKELRDFAASERRQQAALHPAPPFGVLVLDGALRRPIASPITALFERLAGREVGLLVDPPALVFDAPDVDLPEVAADWVRIRSGPNGGTEGRLVGLAGMRRFAANVHLDAAWVAIDGEAPIAIPLGDLERFG